MCSSETKDKTAAIWSSGTDWGQGFFSGTHRIICGWNSWRIPQSKVTILTFSKSSSKLDKIVQRKTWKLRGELHRTNLLSDADGKIKPGSGDKRQRKVEYKEWEKYTSFRRFWNMLLFDSVWKREGEESIDRETGSQTDRGSVRQQCPKENCSWKWKCYTKEEKDTFSNTDAITKTLK